MDLTEVEGLADLLNADTDAQRKLALKQMGGALGALYEEWRQTIIKALAHAEAVIDFGEDEDDCNEQVYAAVGQRVAGLANKIREHLADGRAGEIIRDGLRVAIVGPPNAGKSSLLNLLARREAAIVSDVPGTTRDVVEVHMDLKGYPVSVSDTAGVRDTGDLVEAEGVRRAVHRASEADIVVCMFDASTFPSGVSTQVLELAAQAHITVFNHCDKLNEGQKDARARLLEAANEPRLAWLSPALTAEQRAGWDGDRVGWDGPRIVFSNCVSQGGIRSAVQTLEGAVSSLLDRATDEGSPIITRERHRVHLQTCLDALNVFLSRPAQVDLAAEELRVAARALAAITGRIDVEDLLDVIFSDFCIGK